MVLSDNWLTEPFKVLTPDDDATATTGFQDINVLFAPQTKDESRAAPAPFPDTANIAKPYSRIQHIIQRDFPGQQLIAFKGVKTSATRNAFKSANRTYTKIRPISFPAGSDASFVRYCWGSQSTTPPTAAEFKSGYVFNGPHGTITDGRRGDGNDVFGIGDYEYWAVPTRVGPMTSIKAGNARRDPERSKQVADSFRHREASRVQLGACSNGQPFNCADYR